MRKIYNEKFLYPLTTATYNVLMDQGIDSPEKLKKKSWVDLKSLRNCGKKALSEIAEMCVALDLKLSGEAPKPCPFCGKITNLK